MQFSTTYFKPKPKIKFLDVKRLTLLRYDCTAVEVGGLKERSLTSLMADNFDIIKELIHLSRYIQFMQHFW